MNWHFDALTSLHAVLLGSLWAGFVVVVPGCLLGARPDGGWSASSHGASRLALAAFLLTWAATLLVLNDAAAPRLVVSDPSASKAWLPTLMHQYGGLGPASFEGPDRPLGMRLAEGLWLSGALLGLARVARDLLRLQTWVRAARPMPLSLLLPELDGALGAYIRARGITVRVSGHVLQPSALGMLRPTILVPSDFTEQLGPEERAALLAHEVAHLGRRDFPKNVALHILSALLWFNPAFGALRRRYVQSRELACDAEACRFVSSPVVLARALERIAHFEPAPHPALGTLGDGGALLTRVRALVGRSSGPSLLFRSLALAAVAASASLGVSAASQAASLYFRDSSRSIYLAKDRLDLDHFTADVCMLLRDEGLYDTDDFGGGYAPVSLTLHNREAVINGITLPSPIQDKLQVVFAEHGVRWREETFLRFYQADSEVGVRDGGARYGERIGSGRWLGAR